MKCIPFLFTLLSFASLAQIDSPKNTVSVTETNIDQRSGALISEKLEDEIVSIRLITILPQTPIVEDENYDPKKDPIIYSFTSVFSDSADVDFDRLKAQATLRYKDQQELFQLLYGKGTPDYTVNCYMPHHGIQFLDRMGKTVGFVEICFECEKTKSTEGFDTGLLTDDDYKKLKSLFIQYLGPKFTAYDTQM